MKKRIIFPIFNALIAALIGGLIGYYGFRLWEWALLGALAGFMLGGAFEFLFGLAGLGSWVYQRRVLALALLEVPLAVFFVGPYALMLIQTSPDPHPVCCETPLDFGAQKYEDVRIEAAPEITLAGWYVPPQEQPGPVIVLLHGSRSDRRDGRWFAEQLIASGYGILMYDQRGLGESTGEQVTLAWEDGHDLLAAADWLASRQEVDPARLGAVGLSGGAHVALNAAHEAPLAFAALWLDGTQAQTEADLPQAQNMGEGFATFINGLMIDYAEMQLDRPAPPPFHEIIPGLNQLRIIFVAAGLDEVERRINLQYEPLLGDNAEFWLIDEAWHLGGPHVIPDVYQDRLLAFFAETLPPAP